jgi:hypothetical protein
MAEKDAKVRLNLAASGFLAQLQALSKASKEFEHAVEGIGEGAEKTERKLGAFAQAGKAGMGAVKSSLADLGSTIKSTLTQVATLGGALSMAGAAHSANEVVKGYKDLAFAISAGTGEVMTWQQVQKDIEGTSARWKRGNSEMSESYRALWDDIGDAGFAGAGIESVAKHATAGAGSVKALTNIVGQLKEKFDIPSEGIDDALAAVISMGNKGGASVEDLGEKIGMLGASAKQAGLEGGAGLERMVAMLNLADGVTGNFRKSLKAVTGITDQLGDPDKLKAISKELKIGLVDKKTNKPFAHALEMILAKSGGKQEVLAKVFSGEELKLVTEFGKTYAKAFDSMKGDVKAKTNAGLAAFNDALHQAGQSTLTSAQVDAEAKKRLTDSDRQVAEAMNRLQVAFTKPEMVAALEKLAEVAPKVADALATILGVAVEHPKAAAAALVGGKLAGAALPVVGGVLAKKALEKAAGTGVGVAARAGATRAVGMLGPAGAVAAAGAAGFAVGAVTANAAADHRWDKKNSRMLGLSDATIDARNAMGGSEEQKHAAAAALRAQITASRKSQGGMGGLMDAIYNTGAQVVSSGYRDPQRVAQEKASKQLEQLERSFGKSAVQGDRVAQTFSRLAESLDRVDNVFSKYGGGNGTNGLPPNPGDMSGSAPR